MNDDDLIRRLHAADPAAGLPPAGPERVTHLLEDTMDDQTTPTEENRRRSLLPWLAVAAAVVLVAVLAFQTRGHDDATTTATDRPAASSGDGASSQTLTVGEAGTAGKCLPPSAQYLAAATTAFSGEVTGLQDGLATLTVEEWYAGDETAEVVVRAPSEDMAALLGAVSFEQGGRYLVAADDTGRLMVCGFSAPYDETLAGMYAEAFGG
ncbi:MAG: hypothetical protein ABIQ15_08025 [Nocardioides sp.]